MSSVFFMGAGASADSGIPLTGQLSYAIADHVFRRDGDKRARLVRDYLSTVYSVEPAGLKGASREWRNFVTAAPSRVPDLPSTTDVMPSIIEMLSILDIAIAEGWSFGPVSRPDASPIPGSDLKGDRLLEVREGFAEALVAAFTELDGNRAPHQSLWKLAKASGGEDVFVTTNWDTLLDRVLRVPAEDSPGLDYGSPNMRLVDRNGTQFAHLHQPADRLLLKLHGSFGWLHCPRCGALYANLEELIAPGASGVGARGLDRACHCRGEMDRVIVTPTFVKRYTNLHLANIWMRAQRALEEARRWVFVGYSLPDDDLWIRGMLLRAITIRRRKAKELQVHVVTLGESPGMTRRFRQLFPGSLEFHTEGLERFVDLGQQAWLT